MNRPILYITLTAVLAGCAQVTREAPAGHAAGAPAHWTYEGAAGPAHWGELAPDFGLCASGVNQTPVDIRGAITAALPRLNIGYKTLGQEVVNNGHTLQVNVAPGSVLTINGVPFELKQFHFHAPSENLVDGKPYAMEAHLVHADQGGHLAVIGVLYRLGAADPTIARIWAASQPQADTRQALASPVDPKALLPKRRDYFAFNGSLTTPPCTEGVRWMVLKEPLMVSAEQVAFLEQAVHGHNNRPIQPVNARMILR